MTFYIRASTLEDSEAINALNEYSLGYKYPLHETIVAMKRIIKAEDEIIYVAIVEDRVVGYVHANVYNTTFSNKMVNVMSIAVQKEWQRHRIGKTLLEYVEKWACEKGGDAVRIMSGEERIDAHLFYNKCGYNSYKKRLCLKKSL